MLEEALKFLNKITGAGYSAYIVGGFVRDYLLGISSDDIDICSNATPKEIKEIFADSCLPSEDYGSVTVLEHNIRYDITTFREDINYIDNRRPGEIRYINDLEKDLLRRDFTINAICMDKSGNIIDLLDGRSDLDKCLIRTIGDPNRRFEEDSLRILRAIRFATILDFSLDDSVKSAIINKKHLLRSLSYYRKKEELNKIFSSNNSIKGIKLLLDLGLDKELELDRLKDINNTDDLIAVWSILNVCDKYPFSTNEKKLIKEVNEALEMDNLNPLNLYKYGLYINSVAGAIKGIDKKDVTGAYISLNIHNRDELDINTIDIIKVLNIKPNSIIKDIYSDITEEVLAGRLVNEKDKLLDYIVNKYKDK